MIEPREKLASRGIEIDLSGPDGNVFYLIRNVSTLAKISGHTKEEVDAIRADMMSGDYQHAINAFDDAFGDFVTLYR